MVVGRIEDETVFLAWLLQKVVWCCKQVWGESPYPAGERNNEVIAFLFDHCALDLGKVFGNGWIISRSPVSESIISVYSCVHNTRAPDGHDPYVFRYQVLGNVIGRKQFGCGLDVSVFSCVVFS